MAEKQGVSNPSEEYSKQCVAKLHRGSLLLKQESNGLHLRWLVLDQTNTYIYWLNPKKDVLLIEQENTIPLTRITKVLVSPDAQVLNNQQESEERVRVSALSFSFDVFFDGQRVEIYSPTQSEFETWLIGLSYLIGNDKVIQAEIPPGQKLRSLDDVDFLRTRLAEMMELTDSLLKEAASLMEIRAKRDRTIAFLLRRVKILLGQTSDEKGQDKQTGRPVSRQDGDTRLAQGGSAESDKNYLERRLIRTEAQVHELEQQLQQRTDASKLPSGPISQQIVDLRKQLRERNEEIVKLNGIIQSYFSTRPRPQSPARNQRSGQAPEVSKTLIPSASNTKVRQQPQLIDNIRSGSRKGQRRGQSRNDERNQRNWQSREIGPSEWETPEAGTYINYPCIYSAEKGDDDDEEEEEEEQEEDEEEDEDDEEEEEEEEEEDYDEEEDEDEVEIRRLELDLARLRRQNARRQLEIQLDRLREFRQKHQIPFGSRRSITPRLSESTQVYLKERQGQKEIQQYRGVPQRQFFLRSKSRTPTPKPNTQDRIQAYKAVSNVNQAIKRDGSLPRRKSKSPAPQFGQRKRSQTPVDERPCGLAADVGRQLRVLQQQREAYYQEQAYRNSWINQKRQTPKEEIDDEDEEIQNDNLVVRGRQILPQPVYVDRDRNAGIWNRRPTNQDIVEEEEDIEDEEEEEDQEEDDEDGENYSRLTREEIEALREYYRFDNEDETVPAQLTSNRDMRTRSPSYTPYQTPLSQRSQRQRSGSLQDNTKTLQGYYTGPERLAQTERVPVRDADKPEWTRVTYSYRDGHNTPTQETRRIGYAASQSNSSQYIPPQPRKKSTTFLIPDQVIRRGRGPTPKGTPRRGKRSTSRASVTSITSFGSSVGNSKTPKKSWSRNRSSSKVVSRSRSRSKQAKDRLTQNWPIGKQGAITGQQIYPSGRPPLPPAKAKSNVRAKSPWGEEQRYFYRRT